MRIDKALVITVAMGVLVEMPHVTATPQKQAMLTMPMAAVEQLHTHLDCLAWVHLGLPGTQIVATTWAPAITKI